MSEQPETAPEVQAPVMTDAEVDAAQLSPLDFPTVRADHAHLRAGYCQICGTFNANITA